MDHFPYFSGENKKKCDHHHLAMYTTPLIQCFCTTCNMMLHWFISLFEKSWSMLSTSKAVTLLKEIAHVVWLTRGRFICWLALCRITIHHSRSLWQDSDYLDEIGERNSLKFLTFLHFPPIASWMEGNLWLRLRFQVFQGSHASCVVPSYPKKTSITIWVFPKIGVPQNGWFIMENPIKMDDLGVPPFKETPISLVTIHENPILNHRKTPTTLQLKGNHHICLRIPAENLASFNKAHHPHRRNGFQPGKRWSVFESIRKKKT